MSRPSDTDPLADLVSDESAIRPRLDVAAALQEADLTAFRRRYSPQAEQVPVELVEQLITLASPALQLVPITAPERAIVTIGGDPAVTEDFSWPHRLDLPADQQEWPAKRDGRPLSFLCAINLDRIEQLHGPWPEARLHGTLLIFIDSDLQGLGWGVDHTQGPFASHPLAADRDDFCVVHIASDATVCEQPAPEQATRWPRILLAGHAIGTLPGHEAIEVDDYSSFANDQSNRDILYTAHDLLNEDRIYSMSKELKRLPSHQLFGWRDGVQRDPRHHCPSQENVWYDREAHFRWQLEQMRKGWSTERILKMRSELPRDFAYERGSRDPWATEDAGGWTHLLTFEGDDTVGWTWGDCGYLHLLIRRDDLAAGRFDRVYLSWQCS